MLGGLLAESVLFFCMRRKKNSGVGKGQKAGAREERDSGDCSCFLSLSLCHRQQQHARIPWEAQDSLDKGTGMQLWSAMAPPTPWSPSQGAVRKEPNIPGAPAAAPVSLAGRGRAMFPRAALPPRDQLDLGWGQVSRARSRADCREVAPGHWTRDEGAWRGASFLAFYQVSRPRCVEPDHRGANRI